jgi:hypothetical protein
MGWDGMGWDGVVWAGLMWLRIRTSGKFFGFHKMLEILEQLHYWRLVKKGAVP